MEGLDVQPEQVWGTIQSCEISRLLRNFVPILQLLYLVSGAPSLQRHRRTIRPRDNLCHVRVSEWSIQKDSRGGQSLIAIWWP